MLIKFKMKIIAVKIFMTIMIVTIGWIAGDNKFVLKQTDPNKHNEWGFFSFRFFFSETKIFLYAKLMYMFIYTQKAIQWKPRYAFKLTSLRD